MKRTLFATTALIAFASQAMAADLMPRMVTKAPVVQPFSWAGVYIGAHGGYAWADYDLTDTGTTGDTVGLKGSGGIFGAQVGYNTYLGRNWVLGYELDVSGTSLKDSGLASTSGFPTESKINYFGTMRTRIGYAADHWLIYATAGAAWAHNEILATNAGAEYHTRNQFMLGWTAGAGVEYAFDRNWSVKAEYLYADLGDSPQAIPVSLQKTDTTLQMVRVGVNYRFDNSAPASAAAPAYPVKARPLAMAGWAGGYIGAHAGYVWNDVDAFLPSDFSNIVSIKADGGFAGFTTGYNWLLSPSWLIGLESETSFAWTKATGISAPDALETTAKVNYFGSERARLGYVSGDWLFYATGGLAWAKLNLDMPQGSGGFAYGIEQYRIGWAAGGGLEWMFAPQWSAKVEYLHADYGTYSSRVFGIPADTIDLTSDSVKVGVNYHGDILGALFR